MKKIFSADGIRGKTDYGILSPESLERLGLTLASWWKELTPTPEILIGTDTRESSERIKQRLAMGLTRGGVKVIDAGVMTTPAVSFLIVHTGGFCGGISISGSHLPAIENGIKIFNQAGVKIDDATEFYLEELFSSNLPKSIGSPSARLIKLPQLVDDYIKELIAEYPALKIEKRIAIDYANGAASTIGGKTLARMGLKPLSVNMSPNGTNINRRAGSEYVRHSPMEFAREFRRYGCEIGIALDGDGDRVAFIDQNGKFFDGDMILAMLALDLKQAGQLKKSTVVITQMSNTGLEHHLNNHDIKIQHVRNGDKYITDALLRDDLVLGGEQVGHIIIRTSEKRMTGDGLRTALWILNELGRRSAADISDLTGGLRKWPQVNTSAYLNKRSRLSAHQIPGLSDLLERVKQQVPDLSRLECRPASTEPSYRVMLEAMETPVHVLADIARQVAEHVQDQLECLGHPIEILDCVDGGRIPPTRY
jgi:phosphoglucosamine mutase